MKKRWMFCCLLCLILSATGCSAEANVSNAGGYFNAEPDENGKIAVESELISKTASFFNTVWDGVTVQFFALRASDDSIRMAVNTCQSCSPSPMAYFVQEGDVFICQNCGNQFRADEIGIARGGCNPVPLAAVQRADGTLLVDASDLEVWKNNFENWQGATE